MRFKEKEIVEIDVHELIKGLEEHLGIKARRDYKDKNGYDVMEDLLMEMFYNGHIHRYDPSYKSSFPEDKLETEKYIDELIEKGKLPGNKEIYVDVWW